jgi:hypothetical protein
LDLIAEQHYARRCLDRTGQRAGGVSPEVGKGGPGLAVGRAGGGCDVRAGRARTFREVGDQAADLPQEVPARLGGRPHPLQRRNIAQREAHPHVAAGLDADALDALIGGCLRWPPPGDWRKR